MKIILDYNRTLFNPEADRLYEGVRGVLKGLSRENELLLISMNEPGRNERLKELGIKNYFQKIVFVENKTKEIFESLSQGLKDVVVVGDRVRSEISLGRQLGFTTIWVRQGKFSGELPEESSEPDFIINDIRELQDIISQL